jgi:hypothetical protein
MAGAVMPRREFLRGKNSKLKNSKDAVFQLSIKGAVSYEYLFPV